MSFLLNVILLKVILLWVIFLNVILLFVNLLNVILLFVNLPNVILIIDILLRDRHSAVCHSDKVVVPSYKLILILSLLFIKCSSCEKCKAFDITCIPVISAEENQRNIVITSLLKYYCFWLYFSWHIGICRHYVPSLIFANKYK